MKRWGVYWFVKLWKSHFHVFFSAAEKQILGDLEADMRTDEMDLPSCSWGELIAWCLCHRPQPPALPHQRRGGDALPDGGHHNRHDVSESRAGRPRGAALLPGDRGGAPPQPLPQPEHHWNFQRPVAVETLPHVLSEGAVRAPIPAMQAVHGWARWSKALGFLFSLFSSSLQPISLTSCTRSFV